MKLEGKVAIVTGSGRGIGREIALAYAEKGANVTIAEITVPDMETVAGEITSLGRKALAVHTDVGVEDMVKRMVQRTLEAFGRIDILVNNAGGSFDTVPHRFWELSFEEWQSVIDANLTGCFLCSRAVVPQMMMQKMGSIINVTSGQGKKGSTGYGAYSPAKFGMEGLTQVMALELAPYNIRVNALRPGGSTATPRIIKRTPADRLNTLARADIVRPLALFLASDDSAGITGQSIDCREWNPKHGFGDLSQYLYSPAQK